MEEHGRMSKQAEFKADALREQLIKWRRDFHMHPELGFQEHRTAGIIADQMQELGFRVQTGIANTGVVGLLDGREPGPVVMIRFDMDALPIAEENQVPYASRNPGVMHACGHDGHLAIGLGIATLMAQYRDRMVGTLKLVFQPGEEGMNGAEKMVQEGVMENPRPDVVFAAHLWNNLPAGTIDVTPGPIMAAADRWACSVRGIGGHGAMPDQTVDPIVATAQIVVALQTIVSRNVSPLDTAVISTGTVHGGDAFNVIPGRVELTGTIRTFDPRTRDMVLQRMRDVIDGVATACGAQAELLVVPLTPAVVNGIEPTKVIRASAEAVVGPENVSSGERTMVSEDAAFFLHEVSGCYFLLGAANPQRGLDASHHNPSFDFDENVLELGVAVLAHTCAHYLI
jgi:amidohydrolase